MSAVTIDEFQHDLPGCLSRVEAGETLIVLRVDKPVAKVTPILSSATSQRPAGLCAGEFTILDDFDAPPLDEIVDSFGGP